MEFVEIHISIRNEESEEKFKIIFTFQERNKYIKYLRDKRYNIYDNFENKIRIKSPFIPQLEFEERKDYKDRVEIIYKKNGEIPEYIKTKLKGIFVVSGWIPKSAGCQWCKYRKDVNDILFFCEIKQKNLTNEIKNCKFFQQEKYK